MEFTWLDSSLDASLADLRRPEAVVMVFGAGKLGDEVLAVCKEIGIKVTAVCDNFPEKCGGRLDNYPVLKPKEALARHPEAVFIIAVTMRHVINSIKDQLLLAGVDSAYGAQLVRRFFHFREPPTFRNGEYTRRCLAERAGYDFDQLALSCTEMMILEESTLFITERCSLQCRDCSVMSPRFKHPAHFDLGHMYRDIDTLCSLFDSIQYMVIVGGEAFLHPDFHLVAKYAAAKSNILQVGLITNGTIIPQEEQVAALRDKKIAVRISDYGKSSNKLEKLISVLEAAGVAGEIIPWSEMSWQENRMTGEKQNMDPAALERIYTACTWKTCYSIADGRLTCCAPMLYGMKLKMIPDYPGEFIDLAALAGIGQRGDGQEVAAARQKVQGYMRDSKYFHSCGHCYGWSEEPRRNIKAAEQHEKQESI